MNVIQVEASKIIARFGECERIVHEEADPVADTLIGELVIQGYIPTGCGAHVEWAEVMEFQLIPVFWMQDDEIRCLQVYPSGKVEVF